MDELELTAYDFMNLPRNDKERLEAIKECDITDAIKGLAGKGEYYHGKVDLDEVIKDVEWLISQTEKVELYEIALKYYADDSNWNTYDGVPFMDGGGSEEAKEVLKG